MAGKSEDEIIERHNTCLFPLVLFILVGGSVSLQSYGYIKLAPFNSQNGSHLCYFVPESDSCTVSYINSTRSKGEIALAGFIWVQAFCLLLQISAFVLVCSRIPCCASICVKGCHNLWQCACASCGNGWIVLETISGLISVSAALYLGVSLPVEEVRKISGFVPCVLNGVFEIGKTIGYICYEVKVGCPPSDIFLGTNIKIRNARITSRVHTHIDSRGHEIRRSSYTLHL